MARCVGCHKKMRATNNTGAVCPTCQKFIAEKIKMPCPLCGDVLIQRPDNDYVHGMEPTDCVFQGAEMTLAAWRKLTELENA